MTKLLCIPYMVAMQRILSGQRTDLQTLVALSCLLFGVAFVTGTDVDATIVGWIIGLSATVATAQFQLWQGSKQKEFGLNPMQIADIVMPWQAALGAIAAITLEFYPRASSPGVLGFDWSPAVVFYILLTCALAIAVNIVTYALIGQTSAVTYQASSAQRLLTPGCRTPQDHPDARWRLLFVSRLHPV
jgi:solute carrier family 35 protein E3